MDLALLSEDPTNTPPSQQLWDSYDGRFAKAWTAEGVSDEMRAARDGLEQMLVENNCHTGVRRAKALNRVLWSITLKKMKLEETMAAAQAGDLEAIITILAGDPREMETILVGEAVTTVQLFEAVNMLTAE